MEPKPNFRNLHRLRGHIKRLTNKLYYVLEQGRTYTLSIVMLIISATDTDYRFVIENKHFLAVN